MAIDYLKLFYSTNGNLADMAKYAKAASSTEDSILEAIEMGLVDSKENRTKDVKELRAKYGLPE